jgi:hypothetical protein
LRLFGRHAQYGSNFFHGRLAAVGHRQLTAYSFDRCQRTDLVARRGLPKRA